MFLNSEMNWLMLTEMTAFRVWGGIKNIIDWALFRIRAHVASYCPLVIDCRLHMPTTIQMHQMDSMGLRSFVIRVRLARMTGHSAVWVTHVKKGLATSTGPASTSVVRIEPRSERNTLDQAEGLVGWRGR